MDSIQKSEYQMFLADMKEKIYESGQKAQNLTGF